MIDRAALKFTSKQSMRGKKPSVFIVAAIYVAVAAILSAFLYALSGYDVFFDHVRNVLRVNPYPTYAQLASALPVLRPLGLLLMGSILAIRVVIDVGYMGYCLKISRNEEADTATLFDGFSLFLKILVLELLQLFFIALWSLLLIVPGIVAYYRYRQAFFILLDDPQAGPLDCLRRSKELMAGRKTELFFLDLSFLGWHFLDTAVQVYATVPVLSVWLHPYLGVTRAGFYNRIASVAAPSGEPAEGPG